MISWALIGSIVGTVLGLTGAGGAVIAVPLFIHLAGASLQDATVFSLVAVFISAVLGWIFQRKNTDVSVGVFTAVFSFLGSALTIGFKQNSPLWLIQALFIGICTFSLLTIWKKKSASKSGLGRSMPMTAKRSLLASVSGVFLGALTTMTGLGGGVVLVPWLSGPMKLPLNRAIATSLFTIVFASLGSLLVQSAKISEKIDPLLIAALAMGSVIAALVIKYGVARLQPQTADRLRKVVLTLVIVLSILGLVLKSQ